METGIVTYIYFIFWWYNVAKYTSPMGSFGNLSKLLKSEMWSGQMVVSIVG